ncbi:nad kinase [Perkinsus chesapeaki]|uniref:Nad kinase n=1 Tax=Perkinsus chesapeaki TaxID=330153 RepID=A0A7J6MFX0_PERCH|nr:nad kinase [Perkinsus chesapeaki]
MASNPPRRTNTNGGFMPVTHAFSSSSTFAPPPLLPQTSALLPIQARCISTRADEAPAGPMPDWWNDEKFVVGLRQRTGFNRATMKHLISIFNSLARGKKTLDFSDFDNGFALVNYFINYEEYSKTFNRVKAKVFSRLPGLRPSPRGLYEASGGHPPKRVPLSKDTYLSAFTAFDRDRSGNIDVVEFIQGIAWLARSQANLNTLDSLGDGVPQLPKSHLVRDGRNVNLAWSSRPQVILVTKKWGSNRAKAALLEVGRWLKTAYDIRVVMDPNDPDVGGIAPARCGRFAEFAPHGIENENDSHHTESATEQNSDQQLMVDLVVCLGGDGTVLRTINWLEEGRSLPASADDLNAPASPADVGSPPGNRPMTVMPPPVVAFALGSLGFLTPHPFDRSFWCSSDAFCLVQCRFKTLLNQVIVAPVQDCLGKDDKDVEAAKKKRVFCTLRSRLRCEVIQSEEDPKVLGIHRVLNECLIARGCVSAFHKFDFYVDGQLMTQYQADGLIIATPSGSSAYSMAAGGSLVAPNVPCILVTPIAPHGLSQRPLILPAGATIEVGIPKESRTLPIASFDGATNIELNRGNRVRITTSMSPVPFVSTTQHLDDWFHSLRSKLHWARELR